MKIGMLHLRLFILISLISVLSITGMFVYVIAVTMNPTSVGEIEDDSTTLLNAPREVVVVDIAGQLIAIVTSRSDHGIEIIDVSDPDEPTSLGRCADGDASCGAERLTDSWGVATYTKGGSTYAVVTSYNEDSVEIIDITTPASPTSVGNLKDTTNLNGASFLKITTIGSSTYAVVAAYVGDRVAIVDISDPTNPELTGTLTNDADKVLNGPKSVDVYTVDGSTYAVVGGQSDDGIEIIDISDPTAPASVGRFTDNDSSCSTDGDGGCELNNPTGLEIFSIDDTTYVVIAAQSDSGIQILDITTPTSPTHVGELQDTSDTLLNNPRDVHVFSIGTSTYVLASDCGGGGCTGGGVQVIDITTPTSPTAVGNLAEADDTTMELGGVAYSTVYTFNNSTGTYVYAIALGYTDNGIEMIHLYTEPTVTITSSSGSSGDNTSSDILSYTVTFSLTTNDFTIGDITVTGSANSGSPEASNFAGSGTTYTFDVIRGSSDGTVSVSVAAGKATHTPTGHDNTASNTYTLTIDYHNESSICARHVILGNCGTIAINNDAYRIIDPWSTIPTTEVMVGEPVTITLSTPHNYAAAKINSASVYIEIFGSPANYEESTRIYYAMNGDHHVSDHATQKQLFQVAGATHRTSQDTNVKNLELFEVVFTMVFAKPMDTSYVVVETENALGIPETIYLGNALKVIERPIELLTMEEKSKFEIISEPELKANIRPDMDIEPNMGMLAVDPEPVVSKVTCGKGTILKDKLCVANEMSFYFFFKQFTRLFS